MEAEVLLRIHAHATPLLDALFRVSHALGNTPICAVLVLAAAAWHLRRGERREAVVWIALGLTTLALMEGLKPVVARSRPELWPRLVAQGGFSFPSGHALASATFYPLLAWEVTQRRPAEAARWYALAVALALFIGFGRLYLGVHWPTDVLGGWTLGAAQGLLGILWLGRGGVLAQAAGES